MFPLHAIFQKLRWTILQNSIELANVGYNFTPLIVIFALFSFDAPRPCSNYRYYFVFFSISQDNRPFNNAILKEKKFLKRSQK